MKSAYRKVRSLLVTLGILMAITSLLPSIASAQTLLSPSSAPGFYNLSNTNTAHPVTVTWPSTGHQSNFVISDNPEVISSTSPQVLYYDTSTQLGQWGAASGNVRAGEVRFMDTHYNNTGVPVYLLYSVFNFGTSGANTLAIPGKSGTQGYSCNQAPDSSPYTAGSNEVAQFLQGSWSTSRQYTVQPGQWGGEEFCNLSPGNVSATIYDFSFTPNPMYFELWYTTSSTANPSSPLSIEYLAASSSNAAARATLEYSQEYVNWNVSPPSSCPSQTSICGAAIDLNAQRINASGYLDPASTCAYGGSDTTQENAICDQLDSNYSSDSGLVNVVDPGTPTWPWMADPMGFNGSATSTPGEFEAGYDWADSGNTTPGWEYSTPTGTVLTWNYGEYGIMVSINFNDTNGNTMDVGFGARTTPGATNFENEYWVALDHNTGQVYESYYQPADQSSSSALWWYIDSTTTSVEMTTSGSPWGYSPERFLAEYP